MNIQIKTIHFSDTFHLRQSVMNPEKKITDMKRPRDEFARHFGAFYQGHIVGVASFYEEPHPNEWRIRGMATNEEYQRHGIGRKLIEYAFQEIKDVTRYWCNSRIDVVPFYENLGFQSISDVTQVEGVGERVIMELIP